MAFFVTKVAFWRTSVRVRLVLIAARRSVLLRQVNTARCLHAKMNSTMDKKTFCKRVAIWVAVIID